MPEDKITKLQSCISELNVSSRVHVRTLSSIVGQYVGPVARLRSIPVLRGQTSLS